MTDKEFRRLSRQQLINIIFELQKQEQECRAQLLQVEEMQKERELRVSNVGSIAEAALSLHDVFGRAQAAADQYVEEVTRAHQNANAEAERILGEARQKAAKIIAEARRNAERMRKQAEEERAAMLRWTSD